MTKTIYTHWLPIITRCPLSIFPDFIYVELVCTDFFMDLYTVRKTIRKTIGFKKMFMEDIAALLAKEFPQADVVRVRLMFNRHIVEERNQ